MGPVSPHSPFLPVSVNYNQQIMTKIWTFQTQNEAQNQLGLLSSIKTNQHSDFPNQYCKIVCCHLERVSSSGCWKVIAAFEYPSRSLRQEIILRKKRERKVMYFTQKQLAQILNLVGLFIVDHYAYLCSHSDIFSNLFLLNDQFKLCRPELLPLRCPNKYCNNSNFRQKMADDILELMLLEKVVRGGIREKEKAQYLYSHSLWLVGLLQDVVSERADLLKLSSQSKYVKGRRYGREKEDDVLSEFVKREEEITEPVSEFDLKLTSNDELKAPNPKQQMFQEQKQQKTKPSLSTKIHRSFSFQKQTQQRQLQKNLSPFYHQRNQRKMLLDQYPRQLAQSIGDQQESFSGNYVSPYQNINEVDPVTYPDEMKETNSLIVLEPVLSEENQSMRVNRSLGPKVPTTIIEEEAETYSHQSKKTINSHPSYPSLRSQTSEELKVIEQEGARYEGQVVDGKKHGRGRMTYPGGVYYQGQWQNDQISGYGCLYNNKGKLYYKGSWQNGNFHGRGTFFNSDEESIQGCFDYRDFNEIGKRWKYYEGDFDNDKRNGDGVLTLTNGQTLQAQWKDNAISGRGVFHTLNDEAIKGIWIDNVLYMEESQSEASLS